MSIRIFWVVAFFIIGSVLGSFLNVCGMRIPAGKSIIKPNSHCPRCGHELKWYELIPIISFIMLKGKCKNCKEPISIIYPFAEFFTGVLFAVSFYSYGWSLDLVIALAISSLLVLVIVSDITYLIIPDSFIVITSIIILIANFFKLGILNGLLTVLYGVIAFMILYLILILSSKLFKKETLGGADIKLFFIVGLIFNPLMSMLVLVLACFIALPVSVVLLIKNKENVIPFGPFIVLATLFTFFTKINFEQIMSFLVK